MKNIAFMAAWLGMLSHVALADGHDQTKINTVKAMYQQDMNSLNGLATLTRFAGGGLQKALKKQQAYARRQGELCGFDYDLLWQSQDPDYAEPLQYAVNQQGQVHVKIGREAAVTYALACEGGRCKITDVFSGDSVVELINQDCS